MQLLFIMLGGTRTEKGWKFLSTSLVWKYSLHQPIYRYKIGDLIMARIG